MAELSRYVKKKAARVVAVQLDLETDGFSYRKWGGPQTCKDDDWIDSRIRLWPRKIGFCIPEIGIRRG